MLTSKFNEEILSKERFDEFIYEIIPQQLFHVGKDSIDDRSGAKLEEVILVDLIANSPWF